MSDLVYKQHTEASELSITSFKTPSCSPILTVVVSEKRNTALVIPFDRHVVAGVIMERVQVEDLARSLINWLEVTQDERNEKKQDHAVHAAADSRARC